MTKSVNTEALAWRIEQPDAVVRHVSDRVAVELDAQRDFVATGGIT